MFPTKVAAAKKLILKNQITDWEPVSVECSKELEARGQDPKGIQEIKIEQRKEFVQVCQMHRMHDAQQ